MYIWQKANTEEQFTVLNLDHKLSAPYSPISLSPRSRTPISSFVIETKRKRPALSAVFLDGLERFGYVFPSSSPLQFAIVTLNVTGLRCMFSLGFCRQHYITMWLTTSPQYLINSTKKKREGILCLFYNSI